MLISGGWHYLSEDETLPKPIGDLIWGTVSNREDAHMSRLKNPLTGLQSSRRNLIRIGAIVASGIIAKTTSATADDFRGEDFDRGRERARRWDDGRRDRDEKGGRDPHCFLKGTTIRTADGDRKIEDLAIGELLPTAFGGMARVQWIGRYRFKRSDPTKRLTENELSDFSRLWHDGCVKAIIEAQNVDQNHSAKVWTRGAALRKRCHGCGMGAD